MRSIKISLLTLIGACLLFGGVTDAGPGSWTGEVVGYKCKTEGSSRPAHGCRQQCVKNGQPMGLLTDDGTLVLLVAKKSNRQPHAELRTQIGSRREIYGSLAERDGMKVVTVTGSKAAS